jgi:MFS family permease
MTLWQNREFLKLWSGQTISVFGSLIGRTALPFTAVLVLNATPFQMALLSAADLVSGLLVGLLAGVWVDRLRRRPVLIAADLGRAVLLGTIPAAALLGVLHVEQLYVIAFLVGVLTMFFDVAYHSYLPSLVRREELVEGNSKLTASASVAEVGGFGLSGWLVQWFTAPIAVLIDAVSFLFSALFVGLIRTPERNAARLSFETPTPAGERQNVWQEMAEGAVAVARDPVLRALAGSAMILALFGPMIGTLILLFTTRELGLRPGIQGMIFAVGGVTSLLGALATGRVTRRLGVGRAMVYGLLLSSLGTFCIPLAHGATVAAVLLLVINQLVTDPSHTVYEINQVSLRQAITPDRLLGRVNASIRFVGLAAMLLGTLLGGLLGQTIGLRPTLVIGSCGGLLAALWLALSPVRLLERAPASVTETAATPVS